MIVPTAIPIKTNESSAFVSDNLNIPPTMQHFNQVVLEFMILFERLISCGHHSGDIFRTNFSVMVVKKDVYNRI